MSFKNYFSSLTKNLTPFTKLAQNTKGFIHDIKETIDKSLHPEKLLMSIIEIIPRIFTMPFPTQEIIVPFGIFLNQHYGSHYFIWNISEESYDINYFNKQVSENCVNGYPNPSLHQIFIISFSIISWIKKDKQNIAIIHCQQSKGRTALLFSCLSVLLKYFDHPSEAFLHFCKIVRLDEAKVLFPSQEIYMKYFSHIIDGFKMNRNHIKIIKIMFSDIPEILVPIKNANGVDELKQQNFRPYLQIFKDSKVAFNSLNNNLIPTYMKSDLTIWFDVNITLRDDILIRCKHYQTNEIRFPVFRVMLNTGFFFDNVIRIYKRFMDLSSNVKIEDGFFMDIFFSEEKASPSLKDQTAEEIESNVKNLINDHDYSFILEECNSRLKDNDPSQSDFSLQLSKIVNTRNPSNSPLKAFSISEENSSNIIEKKPKIVEKPKITEEEEKKENEEILNTLKEKEEIHKDQEETMELINKEVDPNKDLLNKIIEVDHDEPEENVDDYFSKLEQV